MEASGAGGNLLDESWSVEEESFCGDGDSSIISEDPPEDSESLFSINLRKYADYLEERFPLPMCNCFMEDE